MKHVDYLTLTAPHMPWGVRPHGTKRWPPVAVFPLAGKAGITRRGDDGVDERWGASADRPLAAERAARYGRATGWGWPTGEANGACSLDLDAHRLTGSAPAARLLTDEAAAMLVLEPALGEDLAREVYAVAGVRQRTNRGGVHLLFAHERRRLPAPGIGGARQGIARGHALRRRHGPGARRPRREARRDAGRAGRTRAAARRAAGPPARSAGRGPLARPAGVAARASGAAGDRSRGGRRGGGRGRARALQEAHRAGARHVAKATATSG